MTATDEHFWVGGAGGGNYNDSTKWSHSSGGAGGAGVPGSGNDVRFDANSGAGTCTVNVDSSAKSVDATGAATSNISGPGIWSLFGDVTALHGRYVSPNGALALAGSGTQIVGPSSGGSAIAPAQLRFTGTGEKQWSGRMVLQSGNGIRATVNSTVKIAVDANTIWFGPGTNEAWVRADPGFTLTLRSLTPGTRWDYDTNAVNRAVTFYRCDIQDCNFTGGGFAFATDFTNVDSGNNTSNIAFTPTSSVIESVATFFDSSSLDYGPECVVNGLGQLVMLYADSLSNNNSRVMARSSTDGGNTWSARTVLWSTSAQGDGIIRNTGGAGNELWAVIDADDILHVTGHHIVSGNTAPYYTRCRVSSVANITSFAQWTAASGTAPPSSGGGFNGAGFDTVATTAIDPTVAVNSKGHVLVAFNDALGGTGPASLRVFRDGAWTPAKSSAPVALSFGGLSVLDIVFVVVGKNDDWHMVVNVTEGGRKGAAYKTCLAANDPTVAANWTKADGTAGYDTVINIAAGAIGFPRIVVDSEGNVHVVGAGGAGGTTWYHNFRRFGETAWVRGTTIGSAGTAVTNQATPGDVDRYGIGADANENVLLVYRKTAQPGGAYVYQRFGSAETWGTATNLRHAGGGSVTAVDLNVRSGGTKLAYQASQGSFTDGRQPAIVWQGISVAAGNAWWDARRKRRRGIEDHPTVFPGTHLQQRRR